MPIYHQGRKVKEVYHQGRKVKEIWHMGRLIYRHGPRRFTVGRNAGGLLTSSTWDTESLTGDTSLVQSISPSGLYLSNHAIYTRAGGGLGLTTGSGISIDPGEPVPAGVQLTSLANDTYLFTEILGRPVEVMKPTDNARSWLRNTVSKYGLDYTTVTKLPFDIDSSSATNLYSMFQGCVELTAVPRMDTSQATNLQYMFQDCKSLRDGSVTLTVKRRGASTTNMLFGSGLTREPFLTIE